SSADDVRPRQSCGGHYGRCLANFQSRIALSLADGLVKWKKDKLLAQTGDEDRWPILVIPDLHREDRALRQRINLREEGARAFFNVTKAARDLACWIEYSSAIAFAGNRPLPRCQDGITRFHRLQKPVCTDRFRAPFRR